MLAFKPDPTIIGMWDRAVEATGRTSDPSRKLLHYYKVHDQLHLDQVVKVNMNILMAIYIKAKEFFMKMKQVDMVCLEDSLNAIRRM